MNLAKKLKLIKSKPWSKNDASERGDTLATKVLGENLVNLGISLANYTRQKLDVEAAEMLQKKTLLDNH